MGRLPGSTSESPESSSAPIDCADGDDRGCPVEALSNKPSRSWIGRSSSDATHSTRRASIGTVNGRWGPWIRERRNRDEVVIITKGCHPDGRGHPRLSASSVTRNLHARIEAFMEQLNGHIDKGKIGAIGASNWSHERISSANSFAAGNGLQSFAASSVQFSLADWKRSPWPGAVTLEGDGQRTAREWYSAHVCPCSRGLTSLVDSSQLTTIRRIQTTTP
jgi:hypothetical protein